ncbi:hypothetical protein ACH492_19090 [Streptomyces sp. NPDC019443]|uniref:hypothetical protein n=1 Tax=Streptomyces sp. NPDC019443 TaxID=3365061 RepID=UPI0037A5ACAC
MCAVALLVVLTGCGDGGPTSSASPAPRSTPPQELCERLISHWARVVLDGGEQANLDYQAMGLSGGQNEILLDVVTAARAEQKRQGTDAARKLIDRQAADRCTERHRGGTPTGGPWQ